jgi:hypothetical protein
MTVKIASQEVLASPNNYNPHDVENSNRFQGVEKFQLHSTIQTSRISMVI